MSNHEANGGEAVLYRGKDARPAGSLLSYIRLLKPRETSLLAFCGLCATIIACRGYPPTDLLFTSLAAVTLGSAGANGLTNYLDREMDALMRRTRGRPLPAQRIAPAEKALPLTVGLILAGLVLAYAMHPYAAAAGLSGVLTAIVGRKRSVFTHLWGGIAGTAPLLVGWLGARPFFDATLVLMALLIMCWVPVHVWSVMLAYWEDYQQAGLRWFPLWWTKSGTTRIIVVGAVFTYVVSLAVYWAGGFGWLYLGTANVMGLLMLYASLRLMANVESLGAWRLYKLTAFPYLGIIFLALCLDLWLAPWLG